MRIWSCCGLYSSKHDCELLQKIQGSDNLKISKIFSDRNDDVVFSFIELTIKAVWPAE